MTTSRPTAIAAELQRAVWRWHFFAGLLVLPFLLWLAVTGALYLYKPEIERQVYADWIHVTPARATLPLETLAARVGASVGGTRSRLLSASEPALSATEARTRVSCSAARRLSV